MSSRWRCYLGLQLGQVGHHLPAVGHQLLQTVLQTLQLLARLRLLAAPLAQVGDAAALQLGVQLDVERPLVEDPLHLHLTVSGELRRSSTLELRA